MFQEEEMFREEEEVFLEWSADDRGFFKVCIDCAFIFPHRGSPRGLNGVRCPRLRTFPKRPGTSWIQVIISRLSILPKPWRNSWWSKYCFTGGGELMKQLRPEAVEDGRPDMAESGLTECSERWKRGRVLSNQRPAALAPVQSAFGRARRRPMGAQLWWSAAHRLPGRTAAPSRLSPPGFSHSAAAPPIPPTGASPPSSTTSSCSFPAPPGLSLLSLSDP
ncbi:hypothetical protein NHX12_026032 [Muraenolepis orangiensis]|uniref:Uncharacterized protein n=1 Tax=Muraenolepis orangiensis TaxID=630683 RepID=A0A9Q0EIV3_9TELE|nr:hypothetical protein NHX12_026032 [Muraenolepis orangiensis]